MTTPTPTPTPTSLIHQVQDGLDRYEAWHQVLISGKDQLASSIAEMTLANQRRWGKYPDADPDTGVSDSYVDDLIYHYLTQRRSIRALKQRQRGAWQSVMDWLTLRINQRLHARPDVKLERIADLTDDLAQHCATVIWMRLDAFTFDCSFWSWMEVLVAREMRGFLRKADHRHNTNVLRLDDSLEEATYVPHQRSAYHQVDDFLLLEGLLPVLPADQQQAIALTLYGYDCEAIAELMDRSVSAVHSLRSRAYQCMRRASAGKSRHG